MFADFAQSVEFPDYFGANWPAFDECLADLSWLDFSRITILISNADCLLVEERDHELFVFLKIIAKVGEEWSTAVHDGEWWDHDEVPFHVIFQVDDFASARRLVDRIRRTGLGVSSDAILLTG